MRALKGSISGLAALLALTMGFGLARADYPEKTIKFVSANPAGGDALMRIVAQELEKRWKQPVTVENRPGAGGLIALEHVAKSEPDGYTLFGNGSTSHFIHHLLTKDLRVDTRRDFVVVATYSRSPSMILTNTATARNYPEFIAALKANPDKFKYGDLGRTAIMMSLEWFKNLTGTRILEVPYKGTNEITLALMRNEIQMTYLSGGNMRSQIEAGVVKPMFVAHPTRLPDFPDVPTAVEVGLPGFNAYFWNCILAPARTPASIVQKIHNDMREVTASPEFIQTLGRAGAQAMFLESRDIPGFVEKTVAEWTAVARAIKIQPE